MRGAEESGNRVEKSELRKKYRVLQGLLLLQKQRRRVRYQRRHGRGSAKMIDADVIVLASPVYFYSIDAQLKAVIDRTVARWLEVKDKEFYYIMTAADDVKESMETTLACFRGYADCVEGAKECGVIYGTGVYEKGEIKNTPAMKKLTLWENRFNTDLILSTVPPCFFCIIVLATSYNTVR